MIADKFTATNLELLTMLKIVKRAESLGVDYGDRLTRMMDIEVAHNTNPLNLEEMLNGDDSDFLHDILGIATNLNRETGEIENCFSPRFSAR